MEAEKQKDKWWKIALKEVAKFAIGLIIKNQKGIKGTANEEKIDNVLDKI